MLLLNTSLTVEEGAAGSHAKKGWEEVTDAIVKAVSDRARPAVFALWGGLRARYGGDGSFLFGKRSIADAMFAPVATRLRTYAVEAPDVAQAYCESIFADGAFKEWEAAANAETWTIEQTDSLHR